MSVAISREFRLLAAASSWPPGPARDANVLGLSEGADWYGFADLARRHRVEGLVWAALAESDATPPPGIADQFRNLAWEVARTSLVCATQSARLQGALGAAGIPSLVMKGSAVEILAFGRLGLKNAWDIDLLVASADVGPAIAVLGGQGYSITEPAGLSPRQFATWVQLAKECELRHGASGLTVELHWRLADGPSLLPGVGMNSGSQRVDIGGGSSLTTFGRDELFSYLCVHGAMHAWSRLKWLADLAAWLSHESPEAVTALWRRSRELGSGHCSSQALLLCRDVLGLPLAPALEAELRRSRTVRWLVRVAVDAMAGGGAAEIEDRPFLATRILSSQMALGGTWRHAWSELGYRWISLHDRVYLPLPRGLAFLYPILRLPLWLGRRLGVGRG